MYGRYPSASLLRYLIKSASHESSFFRRVRHAYLHASRIEENISQLVTKPKNDNVAGLQLADLVVSPIGRFVLDRSVKEDFKIIESKFRRDGRGRYEGAGLVVLPKK